MFSNLREDIRAFQSHHGRSVLVYLYYPMFSATLLFRFSAWLHSVHLRPLSYLCVRLNDFLHGVWIGPKVKIGPGLFLAHARGLVVNPDTQIGRNAVILQGVTIGGPGIRIGDDVLIGAGAMLISRRHKGNGLRIGNGVKIGAGAVVLSDAPDGAVLVGNPATNQNDPTKHRTT